MAIIIKGLSHIFKKFASLSPISPHTFCFSSSLKYIDNRIRSTFPELFGRYEDLNPPPTESVNYLMTLNT